MLCINEFSRLYVHAIGSAMKTDLESFREGKKKQILLTRQHHLEELWVHSQKAQVLLLLHCQLQPWATTCFWIRGFFHIKWWNWPRYFPMHLFVVVGIFLFICKSSPRSTPWVRDGVLKVQLFPLAYFSEEVTVLTTANHSHSCKLMLSDHNS